MEKEEFKEVKNNTNKKKTWILSQIYKKRKNTSRLRRIKLRDKLMKSSIN